MATDLTPPKKPPDSVFESTVQHKRRVIDTKVRAIARELIKINSALDDERFRPLLLVAGKQILLVNDAGLTLEKIGMVSPETGDFRSAIAVYGNLLKQLTKTLEMLGLTPSAVQGFSHARPVLDIPAVRQRMMSEGKADA